MTEDQTHDEHVNETTGEIELRRPPTTNAWLDRLQPNQTTDGWIPAMPSIIRAAEYVYQTPFVPPGLRTPGGTIGAIMYGREIGLPPITAVQSIHEIKGNVGMKAETMRAMILAAGHEFRVVESTAQRCRIRVRRKADALDPEAWQIVEYTYAEAVLAGDDRNKEGKQQGTNYQRRPVDMLVARCTTRAARLVFPDVIRGMGGLEELDDLAREEIREREGNPFHAEERTTGVTRQAPAEQQAAPRRRATPVDARRRKVEPEPAKPEPAKPAADEPVDAEFTEVVPEPAKPDAPAPAEPDASPSPATETEPEASPSAEGADRPAGPTIAASQRAMMMGHFSRFGLGDDRDERLAVLSTLVGRPVGSANDLTRQEASRVIDFLAKTRDRERLYATMDEAARPSEPEAGQ